MKVVMKDYDLKHFKEKDIYSIEEVLTIIEDMEKEIDILEDKVEELEHDIEENYIRKEDNEDYGIYDHDFI